MSTLRGRAAQSLRPGHTIKAVLSSEIPLTTDKFVKEASITDIHSVYKLLVKQENSIRSKDKKLRGMNYDSFLTLFRFARYLGLVEEVREEPMLREAKLLSIRVEPSGPHIVESKRIIYKLTPKGVEEENAWSNLHGTWKAKSSKD